MNKTHNMIKSFLLFFLFTARILANEEDAILRYLSSDDRVKITKGLRLARKVDSLKVNNQLVALLDCNHKAWGKEGVFYLPASQGALLVLQKRFPEFVSDGRIFMVTDERARLFKKEWALNKEEIIYHNDNTHSYKEPLGEITVKKENSRLISSKVEKKASNKPLRKKKSLTSSVRTLVNNERPYLILIFIGCLLLGSGYVFIKNKGNN